MVSSDRCTSAINAARTARLSSPVSLDFAATMRAIPSRMSTDYRLFYWNGIQGRGEYVRLAFEDAGIAYDDVGRHDEEALARVLEPSLESLTPFALPVLHHHN